MSSRLLRTTLNKNENYAWYLLRHRLRKENRKVFTVDDLRSFGLDGYFTDSRHQFGNFFRKLKQTERVVRVGWRPSEYEPNHGHMVGEYQIVEGVES